MSPHPQPYLDRDYAEQSQARITAHLDHAKRVEAIANARLRCSAMCPIWNHTEEDCEFCGNEECVEAWKELEKLEGDSE